MNVGVVKWYRRDLEYGFLTDDFGRDFFLSGNVIDRDGVGDLMPGQRVTFDAVMDRRGRGWRVSAIRLADHSAVERSAA
jgi:cold shock CspA family protein